VTLMAILEVETFTLNPGIDASAFRDLDEAMQEWCYLNRTGLARRTTAKQDEGKYIVITLFAEASNSDASYYTSKDSVVANWSAVIERDSRSLNVYSLL